MESSAFPVGPVLASAPQTQIGTYKRSGPTESQLKTTSIVGPVLLRGVARPGRRLVLRNSETVAGSLGKRGRAKTLASVPPPGAATLPLLRQLVPALALAGLALLLELLPPQGLALRDGSGFGWTQLWTGHFAHWTHSHFLWDWILFAAFAGLLAREEGWRIWLWPALAAPLISLGILLGIPSIDEYRGLSALATFLFTRYTAVFAIRHRNTDRTSALLFGILPLSALAAKSLYEALSGSFLFVGDLGPYAAPLPEAHLLGIFAALPWIFLSVRGTRQPR